jgi:transposase-like protein
MGSISKFCPHCGSHNVIKQMERFNFVEGIYYTGEEVERLLKGTEAYYECEVCHSTWEPHLHKAHHTYD